MKQTPASSVAIGLAGFILGIFSLIGLARDLDDALCPEIAKGEAIQAVDSRLLRAGWNPYSPPGTRIDALQRKLAGNSLSSLVACSGVGIGFCRYEYKKGESRIAIITYPDLDDNGRIGSKGGYVDSCFLVKTDHAGSMGGRHEWIMLAVALSRYQGIAYPFSA